MPGIYASASQRLITGGLVWTLGSFSVMLVGPGYTPNYGSDALLTDIPASSHLLVAPVALAGEAAAAGYCQANNVTWASLTTTAAIEGVAVLQNIAGVWNLVAYLDQGSGFGVAAAGVPATVVWDTRGLFRP